MKTHEDVLREALENRKDPHVAWAAYCFGVEPESVTRAERAQAKTENFYLLYGASFMASIDWPQSL